MDIKIQQKKTSKSILNNNIKPGLLLTGRNGIVVDTSEECYNGGIVIQVIR